MCPFHPPPLSRVKLRYRPSAFLTVPAHINIGMLTAFDNTRVHFNPSPLSRISRGVYIYIIPPLVYLSREFLLFFGRPNFPLATAFSQFSREDFFFLALVSRPNSTACIFFSIVVPLLYIIYTIVCILSNKKPPFFRGPFY